MSDRLNERVEAPGKVEGKQLFIREREKKKLQKKLLHFNFLSSGQAVRIDRQQVILDKTREEKIAEILKASAYFPEQQ